MLQPHLSKTKPVLFTVIYTIDTSRWWTSRRSSSTRSLRSSSTNKEAVSFCSSVGKPKRRLRSSNLSIQFCDVREDRVEVLLDTSIAMEYQLSVPCRFTAHASSNSSNVPHGVDGCWSGCCLAMKEEKCRRTRWRKTFHFMVFKIYLKLGFLCSDWFDLLYICSLIVNGRRRWIFLLCFDFALVSRFWVWLFSMGFFKKSFEWLMTQKLAMELDFGVGEMRV